METKKIKNEKPGAWIVNPKDRGRFSVKSGGRIYLEKDFNFEIEIFNPLKECVLADIRLNGQSISKTGLVIKPGQRVYLDCFVDDRKKFIFQTYEIEMSDEAQEAIQNNGLMEVFFYKEEAVSLKNWPEKLRQVVVREYYPIYVDRYPYWYRSYPTWYGGCTTTIGSNLQNTGTTVNALYNSTTGTFNAQYSTSNNFTFTSGTSDSTSLNIDLSNLSVGGSIPIAGSFETGRVEKGQKSNQQFGEIDMDFEKNYIHHIVYNLLPSSRKPVEVETKKPLDESHQAASLLVKLKDLKDAGIISDDEFLEKKKELLARI